MKSFRHQKRPKKSSLIIGKAALINAIRSGKGIDRIYLNEKEKGSEFSEIKKLAAESGIPINKVPLVKLDGFNVTDHEGCIGTISKVQYFDLQDIISFTQEKGESPLFLILDGITDVRNIGGIARSAWATGVHAIIIPARGIAALNEDALLTSAGALEKIALCRVESLMKTVDELHLNGIKVYAAEMKASKPVYEAAFNEPCAIVMGSEEKGIYPALLKVCDERIMIPMSNEFESFNVSVATGIILYEAMKQRLK